MITEATDGIYSDNLVLRKKIYRSRIKKGKYLNELKNKETILNKDRIKLKEIEDEDIQEIEMINKFADGRLIQSITNYKYKENTCPEIELGLHSSG